MAVYQFSALSSGQAISFDPNADRLNFDQATISAADLHLAVEGSNLRLSVAEKSVVLNSVATGQLATSNVSFANGSLLLIGDNTSGTAGDNAANSFTGGAGNDLLMGLGGADTMSGGAGNDVYYVTSGDAISDSGGIDTIYADSSFALPSPIENIVYTGSANTSSVGNSLANAMTGNSGNNYMEGRSGDDTLTGGAGTDTLVGGAGNDSFVFVDATPDNVTDFAAGADKIHLDASFFSKLGAAGNFAAGDARFFAGSAAHDADDRVIYNSSTGQLFYDADGNGTGASQLIATLTNRPALTATDIAVDGTGSGGGGNVIRGTEGNDTLVGTEGADTLEGLGGDDSLVGHEGADVYRGGDGNDTLDGDSSRFGDIDADVETLDGGLGNDTFVVDNPADVLSDAGGIDTVVAVNINWTLGAGFENLILANGEAESRRDGIGNELDNVMGDSTHGWHVYFEGRGGNDTLIGSVQEDTLLGGDGNDSLDGAWDYDILDGGAGDDTLYGGDDDHDDTLTGGAGADTFILAGPQSFRDVITDFASGSDKLQLDGAVFAHIGPSGNFAADDERFYAAAGATSGHDATDRVIYDTATGNVYYDDDGSGSGTAQLIATLPALVASDIVVVNGGQNGQVINGTAGDDTLTGGAGDDTINGLGGDDVLNGASGDDRLDGGDGNDWVIGNRGADYLVGGEGNDTLYGGDGDGSAETMDGGAGDDVYVVEAGDVIVADAGGVDKVEVVAGDWTLGAGLENLLLSGTAATGVGTGNEMDNVLINGRWGGELHGLSGNDTLFGGPGDNVLFGGEGGDLLVGEGGNDTLWGADPGTKFHETEPRDTLDGGFGDDVYHVYGDVHLAMLDVIRADPGGIDTVHAHDVSWTLGAGLDNLVLYDSFGSHLTGTGNELDNVIDGSAPEGVSLFGMGGNDLLLGTTFFGAADVHGGDGNDTLFGGSHADQLFGDAGDDVLDGGQLDDTLTGGAGADSFLFTTAPEAWPDTITDFTTGPDKLRFDGRAFTQVGASGNFSSTDARFYAAPGAVSGHDSDDRVIYNTSSGELFYDADGGGAGAAQLVARLGGGTTLTATDIAVDNGSAPGGIVVNGTAGNDSLVGGSGNDTLNGFGGDDTLDGGAGADSMVGGTGDDVYFVDNPGDSVVEAASEGVDLVFSSIAYALPAGLNNLTLTGAAAIDGAGNELGNVITGNGAANRLSGGGGNDSLNGGGGDDRLQGGWNNDTLDGGSGGRDVLWLTGEQSNLSVDLATGLMIGGDAAGTARALLSGLEEVDAGEATHSVRMTGSNGAELLRGGSGRDTLDGGGGNDTVYGSAFAANADGDELYGGAGNDLVSAFGGNGLIDGGTGNDILAGGSGADRFVFSVAPGEANRDSVAFFAPGSDKIVLDGAAHANSGASGDFNAGDARFWSSSTGTAHDADDRVLYNSSTGELWYDADGNGAGAAQRIATLQGTPALSATDISIVNGSGGGGGSGGSVITGTPGNDSLTGTNGDDTIDGGAGNDTMNGLLGNDTYYVTSGDVIQDSGGIDTIFATSSFALPSPIENIIYTGTANTSSVGNSLNNGMTGNSGNNYMEGRGGNDTLAGGSGIDTLVGGAGNDSFVFAEAGAANADRITDFVSGTDKVALDHLAFSLSQGDFAAGDGRFYAAAGAAAGHDADDRVIYNTSTGDLYYDGDGSGAGAAQVIATLTTHPALAATDIAVI